MAKRSQVKKSLFSSSSEISAHFFPTPWFLLGLTPSSQPCVNCWRHFFQEQLCLPRTAGGKRRRRSFCFLSFLGGGIFCRGICFVSRNSSVDTVVGIVHRAHNFLLPALTKENMGKKLSPFPARSRSVRGDDLSMVMWDVLVLVLALVPLTLLSAALSNSECAHRAITVMRSVRLRREATPEREMRG